MLVIAERKDTSERKRTHKKEERGITQEKKSKGKYVEGTEYSVGRRIGYVQGAGINR